MKITFDMILDQLKNTNNVSEKFLLTRLYENYIYHQDLFIDKNFKLEVTLLDIKATYIEILQKIRLQNTSKSFDHNLSNAIKNQLMLLENLMTHFDKTDREKVLETLEHITYLECLLEIPVSFPDIIETCLEHKILLKENFSKERKKL